ncbi:hypothetical protein D3C72_1910440 [compost metagenome]
MAFAAACCAAASSIRFFCATFQNGTCTNCTTFTNMVLDPLLKARARIRSALLTSGKGWLLNSFSIKPIKCAWQCMPKANKAAISSP